ncbi:MAG: rRNA adenine N-6-methyltransferase family protein [Candidatus Hodgkinia cicadicola]
MIAKKKWSQVFINSAWAFKKFTETLSFKPFSLKTVCEIGPGLGALTPYALRCTAFKLILIEIDARFLAIYLSLMRACPGKIDLVLRDAVKVNYYLFVFGGRLQLLVSSLPYNVAARLLILLCCTKCLMLVILQRELVARITNSYSSLSLIFMSYNITRLFSVPPFKFLPKPNVNSVCVLMTPISNVSVRSVCNLINVMRKFSRICNAK